jgi:hypothetical protein
MTTAGRGRLCSIGVRSGIAEQEQPPRRFIAGAEAIDLAEQKGAIGSSRLRRSGTRRPPWRSRQASLTARSSDELPRREYARSGCHKCHASRRRDDDGCQTKTEFSICA